MPYTDWVSNAEVMAQDINSMHDATRLKERELTELLDTNIGECPICHTPLDCEHGFNGWYIACGGCDTRTPPCKTLNIALQFWQSIADCFHTLQAEGVFDD